jgi:NADH-quinone oxidoreductase subunit J
MLTTILFVIFSACILLSALGVILSRSAVYSVLLLVLTMGMMSGLFILLQAYLVATVLILVYAGAILVLFLFVVMLVDYRKLSDDWRGFAVSPLVALILSGLVFWQIFSVIRSFPGPLAQAGVQGTTEEVGRTLFAKYVLPFELTSFLLLAAVVSVVVLAKKERLRS